MSLFEAIFLGIIFIISWEIIKQQAKQGYAERLRAKQHLQQRQIGSKADAEKLRQAILQNLHSSRHGTK